MPPVFPSLLAQHLARLGWSHRAFARNLGRSNGFVSQVIRGERLPPLDLIENWAVSLGLSVTEREAFILEANLEHCPEGIRASHRQLLQEKAALTAEAADLRAQLATVTKTSRRPRRSGRSS